MQVHRGAPRRPVPNTQTNICVQMYECTENKYSFLFAVVVVVSKLSLLLPTRISVFFAVKE